MTGPRGFNAGGPQLGCVICSASAGLVSGPARPGSDWTGTGSAKEQIKTENQRLPKPGLHGLLGASSPAPGRLAELYLLFLVLIFWAGGLIRGPAAPSSGWRRGCSERGGSQSMCFTRANGYKFQNHCVLHGLVKLLGAGLKTEAARPMR